MQPTDSACSPRSRHLAFLSALLVGALLGCGEEALPGAEAGSGGSTTGSGTSGAVGAGGSLATGGTSAGSGGVVSGSGGTAGTFAGSGGTAGTFAGSGGTSAGGTGGTFAGSGGTSAGGTGGSNGGSGGTSSGGSGGTGGSGGSGGSAGSGGSGGTGALPKFVGNITTGNSIDPSGRVFSTYWDQITPENAGKWGSVQSSASSGFNWSALDAIYDYTQQKGIIFKEHVFVWGSQQPSGTLTETHVKTWMQTFCQRYPETRVIDVVNEPPPHTTPSYANAIGGGTNTTWQWIINAFTWAHQYCPNAVLILNDYNNIEYADQNQHFIDIAKALQAADAPIDALGAQAHGLGGGISATTMQNLLTKMHNDTGLPVFITEYDIDLADDSQQLAKYQAHFPFFLNTEWIHGVTIWGCISGSTWVPNSGLIKNGTPRSAMTWLMDQLDRPAP